MVNARCGGCLGGAGKQVLLWIEGELVVGDAWGKLIRGVLRSTGAARVQRGNGESCRHHIPTTTSPGIRS